MDAINAKAISVIVKEMDALSDLTSFINQSFSDTVQLIANSKGRVVITGIGKSAIIAQKITATLNSTGTPSLYMHAADAIHGDLGMIMPDDIVIIISKSGESPEIKVLVPLIKNFGNPIVAICGSVQSYLATNADYLLNTTVKQEACPNNLAPTASTTSQMVMGDALAMCLLDLKGFSSQDFAKYHPGGALGKRLYLTVQDLMKNNDSPKVYSSSNLKNIIVEISTKRLGATAVIDEKNQLLGIITDGDLRRMLESVSLLESINAENLMTKNPKTIQENELAVDALTLMRKYNISQLPVVNDKNNYTGMVHLHDLLREGIL